MKVITNKTHKPIKVPLSGGKFLHLGPAKTGQISDRALEQPALQRLVKAGEIEIAEEGSSQPSTNARTSAGGHEATHGHAQTNVIRPKGDR